MRRKSRMVTTLQAAAHLAGYDTPRHGGHGKNRRFLYRNQRTRSTYGNATTTILGVASRDQERSLIPWLVYSYIKTGKPKSRSASHSSASCRALLSSPLPQSPPSPAPLSHATPPQTALHRPNLPLLWKLATVRVLVCLCFVELAVYGVGDAPVELGRRVEQRLVGGGSGGGGVGGGEGRVGGPAERDGRAGQGGRRCWPRGAAEAAAAGDQGAGQVRRRQARGRRLLHCHVRGAEEAAGGEDRAAAGGPDADVQRPGAEKLGLPRRLRRQEQIQARRGRGPDQHGAAVHRAAEERQDRERQPRHRRHRPRGRQARRSGKKHREIDLRREQSGRGADHDADRAADAARGEAGEHTGRRGLLFTEEHSGEEGAEVRGDAGRAQGLERAAADGGRDDEMGDVRSSGHDAVGAVRLRRMPHYTACFLLFVRFYQFWCPPCPFIL